MTPLRSCRSSAALAMLASLWLVCSCASTGHGPYAPADPAKRDTARAQDLNQQASAVILTHPEQAEKLLREALTADLYLGPAHNNLGVIYLNRGELYSAAGEFEWARKLMPGRPDPRMNLALTLERAGRTEEALSAYAGALETDPSHIETVQALTRLQVRSGRADAGTPGHLDEIATRGTSARWREWAQATKLIRKDPAGSAELPRIKGGQSP